MLKAKRIGQSPDLTSGSSSCLWIVEISGCTLNFSHCEIVVSCCMQVHMIWSNSSCEDKLQLFGFVHPLSRHASWMERGGNNNFGIPNILLKLCSINETSWPCSSDFNVDSWRGQQKLLELSHFEQILSSTSSMQVLKTLSKTDQSTSTQGWSNGLFPLAELSYLLSDVGSCPMWSQYPC